MFIITDVIKELRYGVSYYADVFENRVRLCVLKGKNEIENWNIAEREFVRELDRYILKHPKCYELLVEYR